jgi:hypothetical protein
MPTILRALQNVPETAAGKDASVICDQEDRSPDFNGYWTCQIQDLNGPAVVNLEDIKSYDTDQWIQHEGASDLRNALPVWESHPDSARPLLWRKSATLHVVKLGDDWTGTVQGRIRLP